MAAESRDLDCDIAPAHAGDSVYNRDDLIGTVTSDGYGYRVQKNSAYAFIEPSLSAPDTCLQIEILGEKYEAKVCEPCLLDPENTKVRS